MWRRRAVFSCQWALGAAMVRTSALGRSKILALFSTVPRLFRR
nr:MAG TPA: hypothetical protein [Caudoviricetes sp.]